MIIFVGGTGRCGKSVVAECLAQHSDAFKLPFELRFFTDPDGLVDFYTSSLASWSPFLADRRIKRLGQLLQTLGASPGHQYAGWQLSERIPAWYQHVGQLMQSLYDFRYKCKWVGIGYEDSVYHAGPLAKENLARILGSFIRTVIKDLLESNDKSIFISDDTWSILFAKELSELLPEARFIHVYRDPRDVVSSMSKQRWCPSDLEQAARYYLDLWAAIDNSIGYMVGQVPFGSYHSFKFERMQGRGLSALCKWFGLEFNVSMLKPFDQSAAHIGRWRDEENQEAFKVLGPIVEALGYE